MVQTTSKFRAFVGIRDWNCMSNPVDYGIHYLKEDSGPPMNSGIMDEICLNISEDKYYIFNGSMWIAHDVLLHNRFLFAKEGSQSSGNGENIPTTKIYENHGNLQYYIIDADPGQTILIKTGSYHYIINSSLTYDGQSNSWLTLNASVDAYLKSEINDYSAANSGASLIGVYDNLTHSNNIRLQDVLVDLDNAISSALSGGEVNTAANQGSSGIGLYIQKVGLELQFKNISTTDTNILFVDDIANNVIDINTNATPISTPSTIVSRDVSGDFAANNIYASLHGSADQVDYCDVNDAIINTAALWTSSKIVSEINAKAIGLSWQNPVEHRDYTLPPASPSVGDRYIVGSPASGDWVGHEYDITEWNGSSWDFISDVEGMACYVKYEDKLYTNNGVEWVTFGSVTNHGSLNNLQGGLYPDEYYHLSNNEYNLITTSKNQNTFFASPSDINGIPSFRQITDSDLPVGGTITIDGGNGLSGSGSFNTNQSANTTIILEHVDTTSVVNVGYTDGIVIQNILTDSFGHAIDVGVVDFDFRYWTQSALSNNTSAITSGASLIGVFDEFDNSNNSNTQSVLKDFDNAITNALDGNNDVWSIKTSNYSASANDNIFADTTANSFTILLPSSPTIGDTIIVSDPSDNWAISNLVIDGNGENINSISNNLVCNISGSTIKLVYCNSIYGWIIQ